MEKRGQIIKEPWAEMSFVFLNVTVQNLRLIFLWQSRVIGSSQAQLERQYAGIRSGTGSWFGQFCPLHGGFFFPEIHRKHDFIWSGIGLFYALVLWVCADRITGGVLLGQTASVALLGWLGWQTLILRRQIVPVSQQTAIPSSAELRETFSNLSMPETFSKFSAQVTPVLEKIKTQAQDLTATVTKPKQSPSFVSDDEPYVPLTPADFASARQQRLAEIPVEPEPKPIFEVRESLVDETEAVNEHWPGESASALSEAFETVTENVSEAVDAASDEIKPAVNEVERNFRKPIPTPSGKSEFTIADSQKKETGVFTVITDLAKGLFKSPKASLFMFGSSFGHLSRSSLPKLQKQELRLQKLHSRLQKAHPLLIPSFI